MADVKPYVNTVEHSEGFRLIHEEPVQSNFPMGESIELESDAKYATEITMPTKKRKLSSNDRSTNIQDMSLFILEAQHELEELFEVYKQVSSHQPNPSEVHFTFLNSAVAYLLEESSLSFSKLVEEMYSKLKELEGFMELTLVAVRNSVLFVGQRTMYGIVNEDVDVLEDQSAKCLWCWETRDFKLLPNVQRGFFNVRRISRRKIQERIFALSNMISVLSMPQNNAKYKIDVLKASQKLGKTLNAAGIRSLISQSMQRSFAEKAEIESNLKEKESNKEFDKKKQDADEERKRIDKEIQREKLLAQKEQRRLQEEALKEERRRDKEEAELCKQIKKQEEQSKKDQWRQEKEAAELKKQITLQKQAKIMERFFHCKKVEDSILSTKEVPATEEPCNDNKGSVDTVTSLMDRALSQQKSLAFDDLRRLHIIGWHTSSRTNRSNRWGVRQQPKINIFQKLKLEESFPETVPLAKDKDISTSVVNCCSTESNFDKHLTEHIQTVPNLDACHEIADKLQANYHSLRKLLQFDKSNRPAYYGTWSRKSAIVGPRHPLKKDPFLDYEFQSDEEWEEELGENLSECEDNDDEVLDNENHKDGDEDESEDGFFVPDGYLSENEGVQFDNTPDGVDDEPGENEESRTFFQKQKYLNDLTDQALARCHPLIITNLMHEKSSFNTDDLSGTPKLEQICLQFLCMKPFPGSSTVHISIDRSSNKDRAYCLSEDKDRSTCSSTTFLTPASQLPEFVRAIQSSPNSINKIVVSLQQKFSNISKSRIRNTLRDISEFTNNRWQVKKEVLDRLSLSRSPDICSSRPKGIAMFFSKRCLSLTEETSKI